MNILVKLNKNNNSYTYFNVKEVVFFDDIKAQFVINDKLKKVPAVRTMEGVDNTKLEKVVDGEW